MEKWYQVNSGVETAMWSDRPMQGNMCAIPRSTGEAVSTESWHLNVRIFG